VPWSGGAADPGASGPGPGLGDHVRFGHANCPSGPRPWFGLSPETLRFLEVHPARAISIPGRAWRDFGDSVMLFSATETEPFFNRLTAVRWPEPPHEFDARLRQRAGPLQRPRAEALLLADPGPEHAGGRGGAPRGQRLPGPGRRLRHGPAQGTGVTSASAPAEWGRPGALELPIPTPTVRTSRPPWLWSSASRFRIPEARRDNLKAEIDLTLGQPYFHAYVIKIDGEPVATGERYTFDGASYISSIGTRPSWRGRGFGEFHPPGPWPGISIDAGLDLIYLGVYAENGRAIGCMSRLGFEVLGPRSSDMLLEDAR